MLFFVKAPCVICFIILFFSMVKFIIIHVKTFLLVSLHQCLTNYPPPESPFEALLWGLRACKFALFGICIYIRKMKIR